MIHSAIWIELLSLKILLKELRGRFFTLGNLELAPLGSLREAMLLYVFRADWADCPRACRALCFLGGDPTVEGGFGAFGRWAGN
jgi:hypothetical protein